MYFLKYGPNPASFCLFSFLSHDKYSTNTIKEKCVDGVLGTRTWGGRMVGAEESTELWWHPCPYLFTAQLCSLGKFLLSISAQKIDPRNGLDSLVCSFENSKKFISGKNTKSTKNSFRCRPTSQPSQQSIH